MLTLAEKFRKFAEKHDLLKNVDHVVAAISGGVDSMVMLDLIIGYRWDIHYKVVVAHVNHCLRGKDSDADEKLVSNFCKSRSIRLFSKRVNVHEYARTHSISLEMAGRDLRYNYFQETSAEFDNSVIATGHTKNDQIETVLLRIFRGTGIKGLEGIPIKRDNIIRPILFAGKRELYEYAEESGIPFSEDHTNFKSDFQRNFVRNDLVPQVLERINPNTINAVWNLSEFAKETSELIDKAAKMAYSDVVAEEKRDYIVLEISRLKRYLIAVEKEVLRLSLSQLTTGHVSMDSHTMHNLMEFINSGKTGQYLEFQAQVKIYIDRGTLIIYNEEHSGWDEIDIQPGRKYNTGNFSFQSSLIYEWGDQLFSQDSGEELIDFGKVNGKLRLRHWRFGDQIIPIGLRGRKKLSDLFVDLKVPRFIKDRIPILECDGEIIWICGLKLSDKVKVTSDTKEVLKMQYREL